MCGLRQGILGRLPKKEALRLISGLILQCEVWLLYSFFVKFAYFWIGVRVLAKVKTHYLKMPGISVHIWKIFEQYL